MERRRDKVIEDDAEFKDFLNYQDELATEFTNCLKLEYVQGDLAWVINKGLPGPSFFWQLTKEKIALRTRASNLQL